MSKVINISIDGVGINATHFAAMSEADAVKAMVADGFVPDNDNAWAKKAHAASVKAVADDKKKQEAKDKETAAKEAAGKNGKQS